MSMLLSIFKQDGYRPSVASEEAYKVKLAAAIEWMSFRWVLSPNYVFNPKHSVEAWKSNESSCGRDSKQHSRKESIIGKPTIRGAVGWERNLLSGGVEAR